MNHDSKAGWICPPHSFILWGIAASAAVAAGRGLGFPTPCRTLAPLPTSPPGLHSGSPQGSSKRRREAAVFVSGATRRNFELARFLRRRRKLKNAVAHAPQSSFCDQFSKAPAGSVARHKGPPFCDHVLKDLVGSKLAALGAHRRQCSGPGLPCGPMNDAVCAAGLRPSWRLKTIANAKRANCPFLP